MDKEEIKKRIMADMCKTTKPPSISYLQRRYKIGFVLAKEIYEEYLKPSNNTLK